MTHIYESYIWLTMTHQLWVTTTKSSLIYTNNYVFQYDSDLSDSYLYSLILKILSKITNSVNWTTTPSMRSHDRITLPPFWVLWSKFGKNRKFQTFVNVGLSVVIWGQSLVILNFCPRFWLNLIGNPKTHHDKWPQIGQKLPKNMFSKTDSKWVKHPLFIPQGPYP